MGLLDEGCLLCRLGWRPRKGRKGAPVDALEIDGKTIRLCPYHFRLYYGKEEDKKDARRLMAPHIFEGRSHEVFTEGPHAGKRKE